MGRKNASQNIERETIAEQSFRMVKYEKTQLETRTHGKGHQKLRLDEKGKGFNGAAKLRGERVTQREDLEEKESPRSTLRHARGAPDKKKQYKRGALRSASRPRRQEYTSRKRKEQWKTPASERSLSGRGAIGVQGLKTGSGGKGR